RNNKIIKLDKGGIILGVMKTQLPYESELLQLQENDVIILFTDGITEAKNINDNEFSDERLEKLANSLSSRSANGILVNIQNEIKNFTKGTLQSDDITLVVLKVK
ncbi:MAG TPA: serine/threonine-protein phosphatase, partial [Ignavibacteria bacterium]|nr:serine/threonine-protein phosphatase [Ignavibacteria bacterium]